jgi:hypothetical protein
MPRHAKVAEGEAWVDGEVPVDCRGLLRRVIGLTDDKGKPIWSCTIEFPCGSGAKVFVGLSSEAVKCILPELGQPAES